VSPALFLPYTHKIGTEPQERSAVVPEASGHSGRDIGRVLAKSWTSTGHVGGLPSYLSVAAIAVSLHPELIASARTPAGLP
jgi:hypothetical protein